MGPAWSSEASPLTCWPPLDASTRSASANEAIAANVDVGGCWKKIGCAIPPVAARPVIEPDFRFNSVSVELSLCFDAFYSREPVCIPLEATRYNDPTRIDRDLNSSIERDLFGKPVSTFRIVL